MTLEANMSELVHTQPELLSAVLDRLLPANEELAPAGQMDLGRTVRDDASNSPPLAEALTTVMENLPDGFCQLDGDAQDAALRAAETADPRSFAGLLNLAYTAYYTDARVQGLIAHRTGYEPGPPQPSGYDLAPFDERVLEQVSQRAPLWRKTEAG
jgi:hypothetical protein